jgi:L-lactate utilization protein LutB
MTPKQSYNTLLAKKLIEEFQKRNMEGFYCETKEDALEKAIEMIPKKSTISYGGSETLNEIGLREVLNNGDYNFLDPNSVEGGAEKEKIAHQALASDYYFMSSNAISESGELVNVDDYGNRVASLIFGPKNVIIIAGLNKVVPNLDMAILRTKTYASQMIILKFKQNYSTFEEVSKVSEGVGSQFVITSMSSKKGRIKVILVGENLGY